MLGFSSMQMEIDRLKVLAATIAAQSHSKNGRTNDYNNQLSTSSEVSNADGGNFNSRQHHRAKRNVHVKHAMPMEAVQEKRAMTNHFYRALQLFKSKLQEGVRALIWEYDAHIEAMEVDIGIEMEEKLMTFTPISRNWLDAFLSSSTRIGTIDFRHIIECWAGAPPDVLDESMNNDLNFLTVALENNHEERQITCRFNSMDQRDDMLMGIRNMVAVSNLMMDDDGVYDIGKDDFVVGADI